MSNTDNLKNGLHSERVGFVPPTFGLMQSTFNNNKTPSMAQGKKTPLHASPWSRGP